MAEKAESLNGAVLAYLGDAVIEIMTRKRVIDSGVSNVGKLNKMASHYVRATVQSEGVERILPLLTEKETDIFKRGRNAHGVSIPKSATALEYRRATGMEALFAYLYLEGQTERMELLFDTAFPKEEVEQS